MADTYNIKDLEKRMDGAFGVVTKELNGLRTGRASASLLDGVVVEAYGNHMPISQLGSVSVPEPRMLTVQVWDTTTVKAVEKAIASSGLGLNPQPDGNLIRVPIPALSEERRNELVKVGAKYAEQARISIRNIRRDGMDLAKKLLKDGKMSQDELKKAEGEIQKLTDAWIKKVDDMLAGKKKEIKQV